MGISSTQCTRSALIVRNMHKNKPMFSVFIEDDALWLFKHRYYPSGEEVSTMGDFSCGDYLCLGSSDNLEELKTVVEKAITDYSKRHEAKN